jgi:hypothetical protein
MILYMYRGVERDFHNHRRKLVFVETERRHGTRQKRKEKHQIRPLSRLFHSLGKRRVYFLEHVTVLSEILELCCISARDTACFDQLLECSG